MNRNLKTPFPFERLYVGSGRKTFQIFFFLKKICFHEIQSISMYLWLKQRDQLICFLFKADLLYLFNP